MEYSLQLGYRLGFEKWDTVFQTGDSGSAGVPMTGFVWPRRPGGAGGCCTHSQRSSLVKERDQPTVTQADGSTLLVEGVQGQGSLWGKRTS